MGTCIYTVPTICIYGREMLGADLSNVYVQQRIRKGKGGVDARNNQQPPGDARRTPSRKLLVSPRTSNISRTRPCPSQPHCKRRSWIRSLPEPSSTPSPRSSPNVDPNLGASEDRRPLSSTDASRSAYRALFLVRLSSEVIQVPN